MSSPQPSVGDAPDKPVLCTLGIPMDLGQSRRGVDMGPFALRYAGLNERLRRLGYRLVDQGNVKTPLRDTLDAEGGMAYLPAVAEVCAETYEAVAKIVAAGHLPILLGGDHSISIGTVGGSTHNDAAGLLWVDAHGDFNTPQTSPTGNIHGMPLASLMGYGAAELVHLGRPGPKLSPGDVVVVGVRSLDREERSLLRESGVAVYTMREIDERGMGAVAREALERLGHLSRVHVSLDMDSLDPSVAPGVGTPVPGGLTYREAHLLMEIIADSATVGAVDIVEINPMLDAANETAALALGLVSSLLGKSIL